MWIRPRAGLILILVKLILKKRKSKKKKKGVIAIGSVILKQFMHDYNTIYFLAKYM